MTATAQQVLDVARRNLGVTEHPVGSNIQPFAPIAGHANGQSWCASFVVACARRAAGGGIKLGNESAYTPSLADSFKAQGRYSTKPKVGDVMFLYFPSLGRIAHTGLVEAVFSTYVITIEGNTDEAGGRTGGKVMRKKRALKHLTFGHPAYATPKLAAPAKVPAKAPARQPDPILREGNRGQKVLNVQTALVKHGARGQALNGVFDAAMKKTVQAFQKRKGLLADGVVGQDTWTALRKAP